MNIKHKLLIAPLLALGLTATPALAEKAPAQAEAHQQQVRIAFANNGGIRDWRSEDSRTLYIQDRHRDWYKATLMSPATDLPYSWAIGFDTGPMDTLDRFSTVIVKGQRYAINSLVKVDGPPSHDDEEAA